LHEKKGQNDAGLCLGVGTVHIAIQSAGFPPVLTKLDSLKHQLFVLEKKEMKIVGALLKERSSETSKLN
jgi:hypothetical protein